MTATTEEWRSIEGFVGYYEVSNIGRVRRLDGVDSGGRRWKGRVMKQKVDRYGYANVCLCVENKKYHPRVGRMVAASFIGPCPDGMELSHCDGVRLNNRVTNLKWKTHVQNEADKIIHGTLACGERNGRYTKPEKTLRGEAHPQAKLSSVEVLEIRRVLASGEKTPRIVAIEYGVSKTTILDIKNRLHWSHI